MRRFGLTWIGFSAAPTREVSAGWAWGGVNDTNGYNSEQILAATHFQIYRSIGGDSSDVNTRWFASRVVSYLILRGIGELTEAANADPHLNGAKTRCRSIWRTG